MSPIPALGTRRLRLFVDGVNFTADVSNVRITSAESDSDFVSCAAAAAGGARDYALDVTMAQDTSTTSLWYKLWSSAGSDVAFEVWPNGQATVAPTTPTTTYPKFSGTLTLIEPDGDFLGGEANASNTARFTTEVELPLTGKPTMATA